MRFAPQQQLHCALSAPGAFADVEASTTARYRLSSTRSIQKEISFLSSTPCAESETQGPTTTTGLCPGARPTLLASWWGGSVERSRIRSAGTTPIRLDTSVPFLLCGYNHRRRAHRRILRQSTGFLARYTSIFPMIYQRLSCLNQSTLLFINGQPHAVRPEWVLGGWPYAGAVATADSCCAMAAI